MIPTTPPLNCKSIFLHQYGPAVAAAYGRVSQVHLPITRAPQREKAPSVIQGKILDALRSGPLSCRQVAERTGFTRSCVNKHLVILCKAGTLRREGQGHPVGYQYSLVKAGAVTSSLP